MIIKLYNGRVKLLYGAENGGEGARMYDPRVECIDPPGGPGPGRSGGPRSIKNV